MGEFVTNPSATLPGPKRNGKPMSAAFARDPSVGLSGDEFNQIRDALFDLKIQTSGVVNVKSFGATGDGTTNDTAAIQSAITSAIASKAEIVVPPGRYRLTSTIALNGQFRLTGAGRSRTTLLLDGATAKVKVNDGTDSSQEHHGWSVSDLTVQGTNGALVGLEIGAPSFSPKSAGGDVARVTVTGFATAGISLIAAQLANFDDVWAYQNAGDGVSVTGNGIDNDHVVFRNCRFRNNTLRGVYITQVDKITFDTCDFELNGQEGLYVNRDTTATRKIRHIVIRDSWVEANNNGRGSGGYSQLRFDGGDGANWIESVTLERVSMYVPGSGNYNAYLGRGNFWVDDPYTDNANSIRVIATSIAWVGGRSRVYGWGPQRLLSLEAGSAATVRWEHFGVEQLSDTYPSGYRHATWVNDGTGTLVRLIDQHQNSLTLPTAPPSYADVTASTVIAAKDLMLRVSAGVATNVSGVSESGTGGTYSTGHVLTLTFADGNSTLKHNDTGATLHPFILRSAANWTAPSGAAISFVRQADGSWRELFRQP